MKKMKNMKQLLSVLLVLCLAASPVLAAEDAAQTKIEAQTLLNNYIEFALMSGLDYASDSESRTVFEDKTVYHPDASTDIIFYHSDGTNLDSVFIKRTADVANMSEESTAFAATVMLLLLVVDTYASLEDIVAILSTTAQNFGTDYEFDGHRIMMSFDMLECALTFELNM